jgi:ABC-type multidrug transport system permease subunit
MLAMVAFFELALSGIFLVVGMATRKTETISAVGGAVFFPLIFVSSAMFPSSFFPTWAQDISKYNPVSYASDVVRGLVQGGLTWGTLVSGFSVVGLIAFVTIAATLYQFRKVIS